MKLNQLFRTSVSVSALIVSSHSFAHGGGGSEEMPKKPMPVFERRAPKAPSALDENEVDRLQSEKSIATDVVGIRCKLGEFTECRGMLISLYNLSGKKVAVSHSGIHGVVGFEGLTAGEMYIAKIESEKYEGEVRLKGGNFVLMMGERKEAH